MAKLTRAQQAELTTQYMLNATLRSDLAAANERIARLIAAAKDKIGKLEAQLAAQPVAKPAVKPVAKPVANAVVKPAYVKPPTPQWQLDRIAADEVARAAAIATGATVRAVYAA